MNEEITSDITPEQPSEVLVPPIAEPTIPLVFDNMYCATCRTYKTDSELLKISIDEV